MTAEDALFFDFTLQGVLRGQGRLINVKISILKLNRKIVRVNGSLVVPEDLDGAVTHTKEDYQAKTGRGHAT